MDIINSTRSENIFYGDIFVIKKTGCLVFGHGKSEVCAYHTGEDTKKIGRDMACITEQDGEVYGHFEMGFRAIGVPDPINKRVKLGCFIRMLSEEETRLNQLKDAMEISLDNFIEVSKFNITWAMKGFMPIRDDSKLPVFKNLVKGKNVRCYVVPWCDTPEERGNIVIRCVMKGSSDNNGGEL